MSLAYCELYWRVTCCYVDYSYNVPGKQPDHHGMVERQATFRLPLRTNIRLLKLSIYNPPT